MPLLSCVINVDTRPERSENESMFNGCISRDFLYDGIINKRNLFKGFDAEFIVMVDEHEPLTEKQISDLREVSDVLLIRKHNKRFEQIEDFAAFNDLNYLNALFCARGKYVFHFDGDIGAFTSSPEPIQEQIDLLETYDFVSYPSMWSPLPITDDTFEGNFWVSTRYFCCKRETLDFTEILKCQLDYDYWKTKYPRARLCHWLEHILQGQAKKGVLYPPIDFNRFILFTWGNYHKYTLQRLNNQTFEEVKDWLYTKDYHYPCDLTI